MPKPLCIYHSHCIDGFTSAWVVNRYFGGNIDFVACNYGNPPPDDLHGRNVIIVDFSFPKDTLYEMSTKAKAIVVLDHHKTAMEDLSSFRWPEGWDSSDDTFPDHGIAAVFDMARSGAGITWDYLFSKMPRPRLIDAVEDRDLWLFEKHGTHEIHEVLASYDFDFAVWNDIYNKLEDAETFKQIIGEGGTLLRKADQDIQRIIGSTIRTMKIGGFIVPVVNSAIHMSEIGNRISVNHPFGAIYYDSGKDRMFSLRSKEFGQDVSQIAKQYGGGGHPHASGFRRPIGWEGDE